MVQFFALLALRSPLPGRAAEFAGEAERIGMRVFMPSSLALLGLGFWLIHEGQWDYKLWIILALVGFAASFLTGIGFLAPQSKRLHDEIGRLGADAPEVQARIRRVLTVSRIEAVILVLLVFDMVIKPGA
jgi:hypothetical protein